MEAKPASGRMPTAARKMGVEEGDLQCLCVDVRVATCAEQQLVTITVAWPSQHWIIVKLVAWGASNVVHYPSPLRFEISLGNAAEGLVCYINTGHHPHTDKSFAFINAIFWLTS